MMTLILCMCVFKDNFVFPFSGFLGCCGGDFRGIRERINCWDERLRKWDGRRDCVDMRNLCDAASRRLIDLFKYL